MTRSAIAAAAILAAAVPALAQEPVGEEFWHLSWLAPEPLLESEAEPEAAAPLEGETPMAFYLGARVGYLRGRDAEKGSWLGGVQGRLFLHDMIAVEGSVEFHRDEYLDGDVLVTFYPVQVTAMVFPIPKLDLRPYVLAGAGWYYTRVDYEDELGWYDSETEHAFGIHVGGGVELNTGSKITLNADFRYVFIDEPGVDNSDLEKEEWDYWEITGGINFRF